MDYKYLYRNLILSRQQMSKRSIYTEEHHIIPLGYGGADVACNLVALSSKEHFLAHLLLFKIHTDYISGHAVFNIIRQVHADYVFTALEKRIASACNAVAASLFHKGRKKPAGHAANTSKAKKEYYTKHIHVGKGVSRDDETKEKISLGTKAYFKKNPRPKGATYTPERIAKARENMMEKRILSTCSVCGTTSFNKGTITRWHNDNCKHKRGVL